MFKHISISHSFTWLACSLLLAGCAQTSARNDSFWNSYDVRHPAPPSAPVSQVTRYKEMYDVQILDNDAYYTPPKDFGICSSEDLLNFSCE